MAITKTKKQDILNDLREKISRQKSIIFVGITGIGVKELSDLRNKIKAIGGSFQVVKKTLAQIALKEKSLDFDKKAFKEETALVFGFQDEIGAAKEVFQFSKKNDKLKILGGFIENIFRDSKEVAVFAQLPGREELLGRLLGSMSASASGLVNVLNGNIKGLVVVLSAINKAKN